MPTFNYDVIEKHFEQLFSLVGMLFTAGEASEVQDFIEAGEYGLALQTFLDIVNEEGKRIPQDAVDIVEKMVVLMKNPAEIDLTLLRRSVD